MNKFNLSHNPNRDKFKPQKSAKASDFDKNSNSKQEDNSVTSVTFDTNLRINNHSRNRLQAMVLSGNAESQKDAINIALASYFEGLTNDQKKTIDTFTESLEKRDVRVKNKK